MTVRIHAYKSFRHYGGREITTSTKIVDADFICIQRDDTVLVTLNEAVFGYPKGHKIAVLKNDIVTN